MEHPCCFRAGAGADPRHPGEGGGARETDGASGTGRPRGLRARITDYSAVARRGSLISGRRLISGRQSSAIITIPGPTAPAATPALGFMAFRQRSAHYLKYEIAFKV